MTNVQMNVVAIRQGDGTYVTSLEPGLLLEHLDFVFSLDDPKFLQLFEARKILEVGMKELSKSLFERSKKSLAGGVSSNVRSGGPLPLLFFDRGQGSKIYDVDGNKFIDYVPLILGHSTLAVLEAVQKALEKRHFTPIGIS